MFSTYNTNLLHKLCIFFQQKSFWNAVHCNITRMLIVVGNLIPIYMSGSYRFRTSIQLWPVGHGGYWMAIATKIRSEVAHMKDMQCCVCWTKIGHVNGPWQRCIIDLCNCLHCVQMLEKEVLANRKRLEREAKASLKVTKVTSCSKHVTTLLGGGLYR